MLEELKEVLEDRLNKVNERARSIETSEYQKGMET